MIYFENKNLFSD